LQNENNEIKKYFDEYKERHAENVKRHGYKSATNNECVDKINRILEFLNNLLSRARDELLSLKATDQSMTNKSRADNMTSSHIPQRIVESSTI
jgi:sugar-specific transcriptional regulator TrmB